MIGFAFGGGGAKGAYEAGAYMALRKCHIKPDIIVGTSIGSVNAALIAQGDIKKLKDLWFNTTTDIFDINTEIVDKIKNKKFTNKDFELGFKYIKKIIKNKGIDTSKFFKILKDNIDEEKLRKSKVKFGLVTVKIDGKAEPIEIMIDDIPEGKVAEYILASCYLPIFKLKPIIDNKYYVDGGFYNNIPLSLAERCGCDTIYSIRIKGIGISHNKLNKNTKVINIKPKVNLGSIILFDKDSNERNMRLGYLDTLKVIKNLDGNKYYFKHKSYNYYLKMLRNINKRTLNRLTVKFKAKNDKDLVIKMVENILRKEHIDNLKIYNIKKQIKFIKKNIKFEDKTEERFFKNIKLF